MPSKPIPDINDIRSIELSSEAVRAAVRLARWARLYGCITAQQELAIAGVVVKVRAGTDEVKPGNPVPLPVQLHEIITAAVTMDVIARKQARYLYERVVQECENQGMYRGGWDERRMFINDGH